MLEFFHALGLEICEVWGMSETPCCATCNPRGAVKIGTVGPPSHGVELSLADDGELLVRGELVMRATATDPEKTREAIDDDGWLHTGDIAEIDDDGYLKIVDRKKELIINAAGKNMSPANIEARLKALAPADRPGGRDRRPPALQRRADRARPRRRGRRSRGPARGHRGARATSGSSVAPRSTRRTHLSRVEQIKRFAMLATSGSPAATS